MASDLLYINGREIYECANQLEGYVDPGTPERLAQFLLREGKAAADLADRIVALEAWKAEAMEGLRPFAGLGGEMQRRGWDATNMALALDNPNDPHRVSAVDFFAARRLVEREDGRHG